MNLWLGVGAYMATGIGVLYASEGIARWIDRRRGVPARARAPAPLPPAPPAAPPWRRAWPPFANCAEAVLVLILLGLLWVPLLAAMVWDAVVRGEWVFTPEPPERPFAVAPGDLTERLTRAEIERRERVVDPLGAVPERPFGHLHAAWDRLLAQVQPDDELWAFRALRPGRGARPQLRQGYVQVRQGRPGAFMLTIWRDD